MLKVEVDFINLLVEFVLIFCFCKLRDLICRLLCVVCLGGGLFLLCLVVMMWGFNDRLLLLNVKVICLFFLVLGELLW